MRILILNQAFYPDVASTAQHATDLAWELAAHGHDVTAISSRRCYDRPELRYPSCDTKQSVRILRVRCTGLGKQAKWRRAVDFAVFSFSCLLQVLALPKQDVTIAMTTPPLLSLVAALATTLKGGRFVLWVMDLNPDEAIAAGWLNPKSVITLLLNWLASLSMQAAHTIVALDSFMRDRLAARGIPAEKLLTLPPWSHDGTVQYDSAGAMEFRRHNGLVGKYVVMYSGNHSPCHPLDTLLEATLRLASNPLITFCFVGGGSEFGKVRRFAAQRRLTNIVCIPYQPLDKLSASLCAADLHVVVMGEPFVGVVHPCKVYNIVSLGLPFLYIGPQPSHITEMLPDSANGDWAFPLSHGDVGGLVRAIAENYERGSRRSVDAIVLAQRFSQKVLVGQFVRIIESNVDKKQEAMEVICGAE